MVPMPVVASAHNDRPMQSVYPSRSFALNGLFNNGFAVSCLVWAGLVLLFFASASQGQVRKNVLMLVDVGQSHPGSLAATRRVLEALHSDPRFHVEFYEENLDAMYHPDDWRTYHGNLIVKKYSDRKIDLILLVGPHSIRFLTEPSRALFPDVPAVFCCSVPVPIEQTSTHSRFTGSWLHLGAAGTLDVAMRLLPETRHVFVIGGQAEYDRHLTALAKAALNSYENKLDVTYLTDLPMPQLQETLRHLPSHSVVLFVCFFKDAEGRQFLNSAEALPMVVAASNAPVFGVSDTYLGRGIVGGFVVSFEEQGKIAARDALEILGGKSPQDIPIVQAPNVYMFDWRELQRWNLDEKRLPPGSTVLFRQPTLWERHRRALLTGTLILLGMGALIIYLLFERKMLKLARKAQEQLSGMLINAQEKERRRLAADIHDDFSQRLAVLALGLGTAAQIIPDSPQEANRRLQELSTQASEIGGDLHTFSHQLYSSSLESLGLAPGVRAFCKEFAAQQDINIDFTHDHVPRSVNQDVALCVFRIVQEALRNMKKHSGASSAQVSLESVDNGVHLRVSDQGVGFDPKQLKMSEGLGVRSMEERARLLGGRFSVRSSAGMGTIIDVWLPLEPKITGVE
jgi:signal transduction histidine kinase